MVENKQKTGSGHGGERRIAMVPGGFYPRLRPEQIDGQAKLFR